MRSGAVALALGVAGALKAGAAVPTIQATLTDLASSTERMISYRHQEHLWQTADGAYHLVFNRGSLSSPPGLTLYSSYDGGSTWAFKVALADTDDESTADGVLAGDDLSVVYRTAAGNTGFVQLRYDATLRAWAQVASETAYASTQYEAVNPALAIDSRGTVWCSFVARDRATNDVNIRMLSRAGGGNVWTDTGLIFGPTDHRSIERSARPVALAGGVGMVYTVREVTYWATRTNDLPDNSAWNIGTVYVGAPSSRLTDPYASHFSAVVDDQGHVHVATIDNYDVYYLRRNGSTGAWSAPLRLDDDKNVAYLQLALTNGRITAGWSVQRGRGAVVTSPDGNAFTLAAYLVLPPDAPGVRYGTARVEMPTRSTGPIKLLQQYEDNGVQRLMLYTIPAR